MPLVDMTQSDAEALSQMKFPTQEREFSDIPESPKNEFYNQGTICRLKF